MQFSEDIFITANASREDSYGYGSGFMYNFIHEHNAILPPYFNGGLVASAVRQ